MVTLLYFPSYNGKSEGFGITALCMFHRNFWVTWLTFNGNYTELCATEYPPNNKYPTISNENMADTRKWVLSVSKTTDVTFPEMVHENRSLANSRCCFVIVFVERNITTWQPCEMLLYLSVCVR